MFNINQLNLDEEQKAEDNPMKRSVQDPGRYEGKSPEHSVCNAFNEICLSGIENKSYSKFTECNTSYYDENLCLPISDIMIDNEITNVSQEVKNICEQNQVSQEQLDKAENRIKKNLRRTHIP